MTKKKRYIVVPRTDEARLKGLSTGKGRFSFKGKTARWVDDPALAKEIDTQHGLKGNGDVWVAQDENLEWHEHHDGNTDGRKVSIHHYTFSGVDTSRFKVTKNNGWVWVRKDGRQVRMLREEAEREGYEIVPSRKKEYEKLSKTG